MAKKKRAFKLFTLASCEFQGSSTETVIVQWMLKKVGIPALLNTYSSFHFCADMACASHWAAIMFAVFVLLCWYMQCCRAISLSYDGQGREYWSKYERSKLTSQISVASERSVAFPSSCILPCSLTAVHFSNLLKSDESLHREITKQRSDRMSVCWCRCLPSTFAFLVYLISRMNWKAKLYGRVVWEQHITVLDARADDWKIWLFCYGFWLGIVLLN